MFLHIAENIVAFVCSLIKTLNQKEQIKNILKRKNKNLWRQKRTP